MTERANSRTSSLHNRGNSVFLESVDSSDLDFVKTRTAQNLGESLQSSTTSNTVNEETYIREMMDLREEVMIKKGFIYAILPAMVLGILGNFFPYVFAFCPSHLS
jgi:hypothetical protein